MSDITKERLAELITEWAVISHKLGQYDTHTALLELQQRQELDATKITAQLNAEYDRAIAGPSYGEAAWATPESEQRSGKERIYDSSYLSSGNAWLENRRQQRTGTRADRVYLGLGAVQDAIFPDRMAAAAAADDVIPAKNPQGQQAAATDTPETDFEAWIHKRGHTQYQDAEYVRANVCRGIERRLIAAQAEIKRLVDDDADWLVQEAARLTKALADAQAERDKLDVILTARVKELNDTQIELQRLRDGTCDWWVEQMNAQNIRIARQRAEIDELRRCEIRPIRYEVRNEAGQVLGAETDYTKAQLLFAELTRVRSHHVLELVAVLA